MPSHLRYMSQICNNSADFHSKSVISGIRDIDLTQDVARECMPGCRKQIALPSESPLRSSAVDGMFEYRRAQEVERAVTPARSHAYDPDQPLNRFPVTAFSLPRHSPRMAQASPSTATRSHLLPALHDIPPWPRPASWPVPGLTFSLQAKRKRGPKAPFTYSNPTTIRTCASRPACSA
jgi:hypothetical protein